MKDFILTSCLYYIKNNIDCDDTKLKQIEYGITGIYLTLTKFIIICLISIFLGIFKEMIIFTLLFNILRLSGFGLHATKSWICLITSTLMFIGIPILSLYVEINIYLKIIICFVGTILMYKNAPADTKKRPIVNKKRRLILKTISTICAIIFSVCAFIIKNNFLANCLIFALILENILIAPLTYKIFGLPYNNYISFIKEHPDFIK